MNFRPDLAEKVMAGEKTCTRRLASDNPRSPWFIGRCSLKPGQDYAVCPGRGKTAIGRIFVERVRIEPLGTLTDHAAIREGFPDRQAFEAAWTAINGTYDENAIVWVVDFTREGTI